MARPKMRVRMRELYEQGDEDGQIEGSGEGPAEPLLAAPLQPERMTDFFCTLTLFLLFWTAYWLTKPRR